MKVNIIRKIQSEIDRWVEIERERERGREDREREREREGLMNE